jgi:hypothetical protein
MQDAPLYSSIDPAFTARTASLHKAARDLQRQIYASLPVGQRMMDVLVRIAASSSDYQSLIRGFGRAIYAEFLKVGVRDMPPIRGVPVESLQLNLADRNLASKLPENYGEAFGGKAWRVAFKVARNADLAATVLSEYAAKVAKHPPYEKGNDLKQAEFFALRGIQFVAQTLARNFMRDRDRETLTLVRDEDHDEGTSRSVHIDESDQSAFDKFEDSLTKHEVQQLVQYLNRTVHPDIGIYFDLAAQGYLDGEIIEQGMLPTVKETGVYNSETGWNNFKKKKIWPAIEKFFATHRDLDHKVEVGNGSIEVT